MSTKQNIQPHGRIIIRRKVKELMRDKVDINHKKMFFNRPHPKFTEEMPCLLIYFTDEILDHQNIVPRNYKRNTVLVVDVQIEADSTIDNFVNSDGSINPNNEDDFLDSRAYEIERALGADRFLGLCDLVNDVVLVREQAVEIVYEGQTKVSSLRLFWEIEWRDQIFDTDRLDEFLNFNTKYETTQGAEAEDEVQIREE